MSLNLYTGCIWPRCCSDEDIIKKRTWGIGGLFDTTPLHIITCKQSRMVFNNNNLVKSHVSRPTALSSSKTGVKHTWRIAMLNNSLSSLSIFLSSFYHAESVAVLGLLSRLLQANKQSETTESPWWGKRWHSFTSHSIAVLSYLATASAK